MKHFICFIISVVCLLTTVNAASVSDLKTTDYFYLVDAKDVSKELAGFKNYNQALNYFEQNKDNYQNLLIVKNGLVHKMEYGIVTFDTNSSCSVNVEYKNVIDNSSGYTNGCYGIDGAYLHTSDDVKYIYFKLAGVVGKASSKDVTLVPYELINTRISNYIVINNHLYHQIKQTLNSDFYGSLIDLGEKPIFLEEGNEYYSYDGHYFYKSFYNMIDDYKNGTNNSINNTNPYFNYYQYLPHRTVTNYDLKDLESYFYDILKINRKIEKYIDFGNDSVSDIVNQSQYFNDLGSFLEYQYEYGVNALMMLSLSMNETATGRSSLAYTRNNLFGHAAYDSDVEKNAKRYLSLANSIYSHAKYYISGSYANNLKFQYHGSFFGDKASGMNVSYASDPYWGEKAAQYYLMLDESMGFKDFNSYALGISLNSTPITIYSSNSLDSPIIYETTRNKYYSFVLLDEIDDYYLIQVDPAFDEDFKYDLKSTVGYILKDEIDVILNADKIYPREYVNVTFDAGDGYFKDGSKSVVHKVLKGHIPYVNNPIIEDGIFVNYDQTVIEANNDMVYRAKYKKIESIEINSLPKTSYEINSRIDLENGSLKVKFENEKPIIVPLDTTMVHGFNLKEEGNQKVIIDYFGNELNYDITVSSASKDLVNEIKEELLAILDEYKNLENFDENQSNRVVELKKRIDQYGYPKLSKNQIIEFDKILYKVINHRIGYIIKDNDLDLQISGLSYSIDLEKNLDNKFFKNNIRVFAEEINDDIFNYLSDVAKGQGYKVDYGFGLSLYKNLKKIDNLNQNVIQVKKDLTNDNYIYQVFSFDGDNVYRLPTYQTNDYIQFVNYGFNNYLVAYKETTNIYGQENKEMTVTLANSDKDTTDIGVKCATIVLAILVILIIIVALIKINRQRKKYARYKN